MGGTRNCPIVQLDRQVIIIKSYMTHFTMHAMSDKVRACAVLYYTLYCLVVTFSINTIMK